MATFLAYAAGIWTAIILVVISPLLVRGYRRTKILRGREEGAGSPKAHRDARASLGGGDLNSGPASIFSKNRVSTLFHASEIDRA